jgi:Uri superfamily endonuclease
VQETTDLNSGIYILELFAKSEFSISAKKFIGNIFSKGYYYYIGSAQKNLQSRLNRHKKVEKKVHWHIDYLTTNPLVTFNNHFVLLNLNKNYESLIANNFESVFNCTIPALGFGNSDTNNTKSHLFYRKTKINISEINKYISSLE